MSRNFLTIVALFYALFQSVVAVSRTSPPAGAIVVRSNTVNSGEYATIQAAVNSLPQDSSSRSIFIYPGTYNEQVYISRLGPLTMYGYTTDTSSYTGNQVTIIASATSTSAGNDDASGTLRVHKDDFKMYNINIENASKARIQAVAYSNYGNRTAAYGCGFYGYQDTLLAEQGLQVYLKSYISGAADFIFGQTARAYFGGNRIEVVGGGWITASGRSTNDLGMYVFNSNTVGIAPSALPGTNGSYYLGRPWGNYAKVIFLNTQVSGINPALWSIWSSGDPHIDHVYFADYGTTGVTPTRPSFATLLTGAQAALYNVSSTLGGDYVSWVDTSFVV